jgi:CHAT domain-containing protein
MALMGRLRLAVVVAASLAAAAGLSRAVAAELGKTLAGESCHSDGALELDQPQSIYCGAGTEAVGDVATTPAPQVQTDHRAALTRFIETEDENLECSAPQWTTSGNAVLRICSLKEGGWAHILLGVDAGDRLYRAEGPPSMLQVLEAAIAEDVKKPPLPADNTELQAALSAKISSDILHSPSSDFGQYKSLIEAARLDGAADRYASAEANYRQALAIEQRLFGESSSAVGQTLAELALQVSNQSRFDEAAALFQRAAPIIEASSDDNAHARLASYFALDAANRRQYEDALKFARQAVALRRTEVAQDIERNAQTDSTAVPIVNQGELAHALRIEAEMSWRTGDLSSAKADAEEAIWIVSDESGLPLWWRADTIALVGVINEQQGRVVAAEHDLRDARDLDIKLFGDAAPTAFADMRLGAFYVRQQVYSAALDAYRAGFAIAASDPVARGEVTPEDVVAFTTAELAAGDAAVRGAEIFRASQLVNTGVADQTIARIAASRAAGDPVLSDLVAQMQDAERDREAARVMLSAEFAKSDDQRSKAHEDALEANEKSTSAHFDELVAQVRQKYPQYARLADPGAADLTEAQSNLSAGEAIVSFVFGRDASYALVVRPHDFDAVPLAIGQDAVTADVNDLRKAFVPVLGRPPEFNLKISYGMYQALIAPLRNQIAGIEHLIVVPGAVLSNLPLSLLVTQTPAERDYQHAAWLLRNYAISEVPSLRAFVSLRKEAALRSRAPRPFLGIGAPLFEGSGKAGDKALAALTATCEQAGPVSADLLRALPPLPGTAQEVRSVAARIGGGNADILLGAQATEANFRNQPLDQFAVIYFATHGVLPGELHCDGEPGLALSPPAAKAASTADDGMLQASEIAALKINADLVVLSACNTAATTDGLGGGALQGLSDSFFAAGARAVLASHWEVSSDATQALMVGVFDPANRGHGLADALRQSQLALIGRAASSHPFYWAAFTIIGDSDSAYNRSAQNLIQGNQ